MSLFFLFKKKVGELNPWRSFSHVYSLSCWTEALIAFLHNLYFIFSFNAYLLFLSIINLWLKFLRLHDKIKHITLAFITDFWDFWGELAGGRGKKAYLERYNLHSSFFPASWFDVNSPHWKWFFFSFVMVQFVVTI